MGLQSICYNIQGRVIDLRDGVLFVQDVDGSDQLKVLFYKNPNVLNFEINRIGPITFGLKTNSEICYTKIISKGNN